MLCVLSLYIIGGTYSLKSTLYDKFFEKLFMAILFTFTEFLPEMCWVEIVVVVYWGSNPGLTSNKSTYYSLDYGDNINYNTITNYILIIYELRTELHTSVSGGNQSHNSHANSLAHFPLDWQGTLFLYGHDKASKWKGLGKNSFILPGKVSIYRNSEIMDYI